MAISDHYAQRMVSSPSTAVLSDGPRGYWKLGESSGTSASDTTAFANVGTYNDGVILGWPGGIAGDPDTAAKFDGVDDSVSIPGSSSLNNPSNLTIEGWLFLDSFGEANLGRFVNKSGYQAFVNGSNGSLQFEAQRWATWGKWRTENNAISPGRWYHVAVTYDYSSVSNDPKIYLDGEAVAIIETQAPSGALSDDVSSLIIGNTSTGTRTFDGRIDDVAIYDYQLSEAAIKHHYGETNKYSYDSLYRLTGVEYPNGDNESFTYDPMGNRLTRVFNGNTTNYVYDDADQMTSAGGVGYTYDANGNQTGRGADTFTWDAENRLTATNLGGMAGSYTYNGNGLRMSRTIGGAASTYTWDVASGLPVILKDSQGNRYVHGLDLISRTDGGNAQEYHLYDGLGSTTGLADGAGTVTGSYQYDAFGSVRAQTGATTEWSFTGEQNDPTGLEYLRARYYDNETGRFLSRDPLPLPQKYPYVHNNPANFTDPLGLCSHDDGGDWWNVVDAVKDCADDLAERAGDTAFDIAHLGVEYSASAFYLPYYLTYEGLDLLNSMPGYSEVLVKAMFPHLYGGFLLVEAGGLAGNIAMDCVETHVLRLEEPCFDEGEKPKELIPEPARSWLDKLGIPTPSRVLPGAHPDGTIDFRF